MSELVIVESRASRLNRRREALVAEWSRQDAQAKLLTAELRTVDLHLEVGYIDPQAANGAQNEGISGLAPARWHVIRRNPKGADAYFPIMGPNGEYREPELQVAEDMKKADLWRKGALLELRERQDRKAKEKERQRETEAEQREDEFAHAYSAAKRVTGDGGLTKRTDRKGIR